MIRLHAGFEALPHTLEQLLETLCVLFAVEERTIDACKPHLGPDRFQVLAVCAETNRNVLVLLTVASDELWAAECRKLRCCDPGNTSLFNTQEYFNRFEYSTNLDASVSIGIVTTGVPVHNTSMLVVCPLHNGVSKQTSASWPRLTCSSLAATFEKIILPGVRPANDNTMFMIRLCLRSIELTEIRCRLLNVGLTNGREPQQPQHRVGHGL